MSAELNLEAERSEFEAWAKTKGHDVVSRLETGGKFYVSSFTRHAWDIWQGARSAPVAAPIDAEGLPALPRAEALGATFGGGDFAYGYTSEQMRQAQLDAKSLGYALGRGAAVREYVEGRSSPEIPDSLQARQSVDTPEFRELIDRYMDEIYSYKHECQITRDVEEWRALIAYIDGRTAGTAPEALEPVEGDLLPEIGSRVLIHLGRQDEWVEHTVTGYYVWGALPHQVKDGEKHAHRVFVRVKDSNGYDNARLLAEVPLAAAPSPNSPKEGAK